VTITAETEDFYRDLVEHQQDLVVMFSPEGRLLFVNPAYCDIVGRSEEDLIGSVFMPVTAERYSDVIATQMVKLFRHPYSCTVEQWIHTSKGVRCISWSAKSIVGEGNSVLSIVANGRDVTRIRQELKAIKKKDEELMLIIESGERMYYSHSPAHILTHASPRIQSLLGYPPHSGKRAWTDYLTENPINAAGLERTIRAITSGRREPPYHLEMAKKNGDLIWFEVNEIPVVKNGKTISIVGSMVDVTEKMQVEAGLAEAEFLIKDLRSNRNRSERPALVSPSHTDGTFGYFRGLLSHETVKKEDE
jgi:PAS domain S-box-containing protein